jgi:hypothetical protein
MPRAKTARGKVRGALPRTPARGTPPETPARFPFAPEVPERSSPSRVRSGKSLQTRKRSSSAAHDPRSARVPRRALDGSGPFRRFTNEKRKRANANPSRSAALCGLPLVGPELHDKFGVDKTS